MMLLHVTQGKRAGSCQLRNAFSSVIVALREKGKGSQLKLATASKVTRKRETNTQQSDVKLVRLAFKLRRVDAGHSQATGQQSITG